MNMTPLSGSNKLVVVGGGAAGMMAAGMAAQAGAHVTLLEQNGRLGKKLLITGKGRCNVTNDCQDRARQPCFSSVRPVADRSGRAGTVPA